jgi:hypothetical protein
VVEPRDVPAADGAPTLTGVVDLGPPAPIPATGVLSDAQSDGRFTAGEYVLIEGKDFGKQPTVLIGGRATRVLARTGAGGILTQLPAGLPAGAAAVEVSHPGGKGSRDIPMTRYVVVVQPDAEKAQVLTLDQNGALALASAIDVAGARLVRISADGSFAYVVGGAKVVTVALAAVGGPKVVHQAKLGVDAPIDAGLAGTTLVVVGETAVQGFSLSDPFQPAPYAVSALPKEVVAARPIAADLAPGGGTLALLLADGNRLTIVDFADPSAPLLGAVTELLPGQRLPVARDLAFDPGGTLWVLVGDTPTSAKTGHGPTRLLRLTVGERGAAASSPVDVAGAGPPLKLTPAPVTELAAGTAVADQSDDRPLYVTTIDAKLLAIDGTDAAGGGLADAARGLAQPGLLVRTSGAGSGGPLTAPDGLVLGSVALTPAGERLVATAWNLAAPGGLTFGVLVRAASGSEPGVFVPLGSARPGVIRWPAALGDVQIQP